MITTDINGNTLSADFITAISADNPQYLAKILYEGVDLDCSIVRITITKGSCGSENGFTVGSVVGSTLTAEVMNLTTAVKGKELEVRLGLLVNDSYTWIRLGYFTVSEAPQTAYATTITAYGKAITKTGDAFIAPATQTLANVANSIATSMSALAGQTVTVTFDSGITTSNTITKSMNGLTVYQALEILASVCGGYAVDTNDGNIKICRFSDTATLSRTTATMLNLPVVEESNFEIAGVLCIVVPETEDEEGTVVPAQTFPTTPTGNENLIIQNEYMTQALYTANLATLTGYEYRPATMEFIYGDPRLEGNDVLSITDVDGSVYICPCHMVTHVYSGGLSTQVTSASATAQENEVSSSAGSLTETLSGISENAISARVSAETAKAYAEEAKETTDEINAYAETVSKTVTQILNDGETAGVSAQQAKQSANLALVSLSQVESVLDVLNWIAEHGKYVHTTDQSIVVNKTYYTVVGTAVASPTVDDIQAYYELASNVYSKTTDTTIVSGKTYYTVVGTPVASPVVEDIGTYYELDIDEAVSNYIQTHLALTNEGLYVMADNSEWKVLIASDGVYIIDDNGYNVTKYKDAITIGIDDGSQSYLYLDYHSMQMFDKEGDTYFYVSDLRDKDDNWQATITEQFYGDGTTTQFSVDFLPTSVVSVKINGSTTTAYTLNSHAFTFTTAPVQNATIKITYKTEDRRTKAYTFGTRTPNTDIGGMSIAEGSSVEASGTWSHAEGSTTEASGTFAHAEGQGSIARGEGSHAEGIGTWSTAYGSHAQNCHTEAGYEAQTAIGEYNDNKSANAFEIGNGSYGAPSNAFEVGWNGNVVCAGGLTLNGNKSVANYVVAKGSTTAGSVTWKYHKWYDGTLEMWGTATTTLAIGTAVGSIYTTASDYDIAMPSFVSGVDFITAELSGGGWADITSVANPPKLRLYAPTSYGSASRTLVYYFRGTWS